MQVKKIHLTPISLAKFKSVNTTGETLGKRMLSHIDGEKAIGTTFMKGNARIMSKITCFFKTLYSAKVDLEIRLKDIVIKIAKDYVTGLLIAVVFVVARTETTLVSISRR